MLKDIRYADMNRSGTPLEHFLDRWKKRGTEAIGGVDLWHKLAWAIQQALTEHDQVYVQKVKAHGSVVFWRFRCCENSYYAVTRKGTSISITVYDQPMMKRKKYALKMWKKKFAAERAMQERRTV